MKEAINAPQRSPVFPRTPEKFNPSDFPKKEFMSQSEDKSVEQVPAEDKIVDFKEHTHAEIQKTLETELYKSLKENAISGIFKLKENFGLGNLSTREALGIILDQPEGARVLNDLYNSLHAQEMLVKMSIDTLFNANNNDDTNNKSNENNVIEFPLSKPDKKFPSVLRYY